MEFEKAGAKAVTQRLYFLTNITPSFFFNHGPFFSTHHPITMAVQNERHVYRNNNG